MKQLYSICIISMLLGFSAGAQSDVLGTWYLDYIVKDGVTFPNYFNDNLVFDINFTNTPTGPMGSYEFYTTDGCNTSTGVYSLNSNQITIDLSSSTLLDCLGRPNEIYGGFYYNELDYNIGSTLHTYEIIGAGNDEVLILTNPNNLNTIVYKRLQPSILLIRTWWLHQIDIPGNPIIDIPSTDFPNMELTNNVNVVFGLETQGTGECEGWSANYLISFNGANNLSISNFVETLSACATQAYEGIYFSILGNDSTNFFEYEITNDGETLNLTDILGAKLIFGDVPLTIEDRVISSQAITLKTNPVQNQLELHFDENIVSKGMNYTIYSIEGKPMRSAALNQKLIDIQELKTGMYFISFSDNNTIVSTLKFIKK